MLGRVCHLPRFFGRLKFQQTAIASISQPKDLFWVDGKQRSLS
ncbi:MAG: hypothetical protein RMX89_21460 [Nostoc sp. DedSLP04]|nr:hypothetical protein [Nostoc sp. DedSLP04]